MGTLKRPKAHDDVRTIYTAFDLGEDAHNKDVASCVAEIEAHTSVVTGIEPKFVHEDTFEKLYVTHVHFRSLHTV